MGKHLECRDLGLDCAFVVDADSVEGILEVAGPHAKEVHNLDVTPELVQAVTGAIKDV